jgi:hypothetical protein
MTKTFRLLVIFLTLSLDLSFNVINSYNRGLFRPKIQRRYSTTNLVNGVVESCKAKIRIGMPKESAAAEKRVALSPESVAFLSKFNFSVLIEKDAGNTSNFKNEKYLKAGAQICSSKEVWESDILVSSFKQIVLNSVLSLFLSRSKWNRPLSTKLNK